VGEMSLACLSPTDNIATIFNIYVWDEKKKEVEVLACLEGLNSEASHDHAIQDMSYCPRYVPELEPLLLRTRTSNFFPAY
jgi:hypothetical protein